jgi:hypothetical protein
VLASGSTIAGHFGRLQGAVGRVLAAQAATTP